MTIENVDIDIQDCFTPGNVQEANRLIDIGYRSNSTSKVEQAAHYKDDVHFLLTIIKEMKTKVERSQGQKEPNEFITDLQALLQKHGIVPGMPRG
jgi:hypothetical protein